jgi:hypothetical protein
MPKDGEGSQVSQSALNPSGFKPELRILRSFVVLRCFAWSSGDSELVKKSRVLWKTWIAVTIGS